MFIGITKVICGFQCKSLTLSFILVLNKKHRTQLYFNAYDSYGDGWDGATYSIKRVSDGVVVSDNSGLSPNESGKLAGSFVFTV